MFYIISLLRHLISIFIDIENFVLQIFGTAPMLSEDKLIISKKVKKDYEEGDGKKGMINGVTAVIIPERVSFDFCCCYFSFHHGRGLFQCLQSFENVLMEFFWGGFFSHHEARGDHKGKEQVEWRKRENWKMVQGEVGGVLGLWGVPNA